MGGWALAEGFTAATTTCTGHDIIRYIYTYMIKIR